MSSTAPAGFFSPDANKLDASSKLPFFPPNFIGDVKVIACKGITTRAGDRAFIAELEVLTSNLNEVPTTEPGGVYVGGKYSWFQSLKETGTAYPACIAFLYACLGVDQAKDKAKIEKTIKPKQDKYLNDAIGEANPFAGTRLHLQTANKKTKAKTDFTIHTFSPAAAPKG